MKCSAMYINGKWQDVYKDPVTDTGKRSKKGRVTLWKSGDEYETSVTQPTRWTDKGAQWIECLIPVFENGLLLKDYSFDDVRSNSNKN